MNGRLLIVFLFICGCRSTQAPKIILSYDFYRHGVLETANALTIQYGQADSPNVRSVTVSEKDSVIIAYEEKTTDSGICQSTGGSGFSLTHSFIIGRTVTSQLPKEIPVFLNSSVNTYAAKKYAIDGRDSVEIIFFDELLPMYSFTNAYYCKDCRFFIVYYDPIRDTWFKLSKVVGYRMEDQLLNVTDQLVRDTSFFSKYLKPPAAPTPPPKDE
jgi:hypothetical protein